MIMMHAENGIAIDVLVAQALARGETDPKYHALHPPGRARGRGHPPGDRAGQGRRQRAAVHRAHVGVGGARGGRRGPARRATTCSPRPARSTSTCRSRTSSPSPASRAPSGCARRRCAPSTSTTHADLWKGLRMNELAVVSTDHCPFCMKEQKELGIGELLQDPQRHRRRRAPHGAALPGRRHRRALARALGRDVLHHAGADVRPVPDEGQSSPRAPTPTSSCGIPHGHDRRSASTRSTT